MRGSISAVTISRWKRIVEHPWQSILGREKFKRNSQRSLLHCALASCGAVYCYRSCLCVCNGRAACVCMLVGLLPRQLEITCIDPHQTGFVVKGSDRLQLIKFWPSSAPGKGVCGGAKISGSALLQPARSVCVSPSAFSLSLLSDAAYCRFPVVPQHSYRQLVHQRSVEGLR